MSSKVHMGHTARKRFGQNFLHDRYVIDQIAVSYTHLTLPTKA